MEEVQGRGRFIAEGYSFSSEKDAALAESESKKVEYLESHLDYSNPQSILKIYNKAINERIFKSPVGFFFLKNLQQYLINQPEIDNTSVMAIPMNVSFDGSIREHSNPARARVKPASAPDQKKSAVLPISIILNIALIIGMMAMFVITLKADQPNILNYEKRLTDQYAAWDQELTEREQVVREKERELNIHP